jgi:hypothetical protein
VQSIRAKSRDPDTSFWREPAKPLDPLFADFAKKRAASLDHPIGEIEQFLRQLKAERLSCLEIQRHNQLGRELDTGKSAGFAPFRILSTKLAARR